MSSTSVIMRGRLFTLKEITLIKKTVQKYNAFGRTHISRVICRRLNWVQPNGWLKDRACRDVLLQLQAKKLINLPPSKIKKISPQETTKKEEIIITHNYRQRQIDSCSFNNLRILMVRNTNYEKQWNDFVSKYHYLGYKIIVGKHLKYMVFINETPIACLGWGDAAWAVSCRDVWIGWNKEQRKRNIQTIVNNVRFLIFPWIKIPNLASKVLSMNVKNLINDWHNFYKITPVLLETFVEQDRFIGTCYKASNWTYIGNTIGTSKKGNSHVTHNNIKKVFIYPLLKKYKEILHK